jgi:hypothetical protein
MSYPHALPSQTAIDRARTSAQNGMRRAKADLDKMQAARKKALPAAVLQVEPNPVPVTPETPSPEKPEPQKPAPAIRTQSYPSKPAQQERPGLCPCDSGRQFIDCCAIGSGPASQKAA